MSKNVKMKSLYIWEVSKWMNNGPEDEIPPGGWRGPEDEIPPGGWRTERDTYRTKDGKAKFKFRFAEKGGRVDVDILKTPTYGNKSRDRHKTHRVKSERGGDKICFGNKNSVRNTKDAKKYAKSWAESTWNYIKTGK